MVKPISSYQRLNLLEGFLALDRLIFFTLLILNHVFPDPQGVIYLVKAQCLGHDPGQTSGKKGPEKQNKNQIDLPPGSVPRVFIADIEKIGYP